MWSRSSKYSPRRSLRISLQVRLCCWLVDAGTVFAAAVRLVDDTITDCHTRIVLFQRYSNQPSRFDRSVSLREV